MPRLPNLFRHSSHPHYYHSILHQIYLPELEEQKRYWKQQFQETLYENPHTPLHNQYLLLCDQELRRTKQKIKLCKQRLS